MLFNLESTEDYIGIRNKQNYKMCDFGFYVGSSVNLFLFLAKSAFILLTKAIIKGSG